MITVHDRRQVEESTRSRQLFSCLLPGSILVSEWAWRCIVPVAVLGMSTWDRFPVLGKSEWL